MNIDMFMQFKITLSVKPKTLKHSFQFVVKTLMLIFFGFNIMLKIHLQNGIL